MRPYPFILFFAVMILLSAGAFAQSKEPPMPDPLKALAEQGAQIRYLGQEGGLDGWITIQGGQEQYFYVMPDRQSFVMGLLFGNDGKLITVQQVKKLQEESGENLDFLALEGAVEAQKEARGVDESTSTHRELKTPAEQLFADIEQSNWVALGSETAPVIYTFIDPQCPFCKALVNDLRANYIENGLIQIRMVPVGFKPDTIAQAAFLLAVPNPQSRFYKHIDGDTSAIPVTSDISDQGVQRNLAIMQSWKINVTPFSIYRNKDGEVKIIQGRLQDVADLINDLP